MTCDVKRIGLIGGMSWESTAIYYRLLNEIVRERLGGLHSADIALRSVDFAPIAELQRADRWDEAGRLLGEASRELEAAGAEFVLICSNTMHAVTAEIAASCSLPMVDIVAATARAILAASHSRPLLLATRYTMELPFYAERMRQDHGIEVRVPGAGDRAVLQSIIFDELCRGIVSEGSRQKLMAMIVAAMADGADSVILGCTEICLLLDPDGLPCPGFDSTRIHALAAVDRALARDPAP